MRWRSVGEADCSIARTLSIIGERWTILILREVFLGRSHFDDFQRNTGIARNILSTRLRALVNHGILERYAAPHDRARVEYRLTKKGLDLFPVLVAMLRWGDQWLADENGPPIALVHRPCGAHATPTMVCPNCGEEISASNMIALPRVRAHPARRARRLRAAH
ncbi:MAG TPA: helix-turn-helix domain-containing protein [Candidatus Binataceae bacterium]|nr:helix-turn-helix domain-containing protein [Candidatus Binataceae bacterium]